jgi:dihydropyrimidinase
MVNACSVQPAKIFGMYPQKGAVAMGSDADLVVYNPEFKGSFTVADGLSQVDYCGYEGMERRGRAEIVMLRGSVVARNGTYVGPEGGGRVIHRSVTH